MPPADDAMAPFPPELEVLRRASEGDEEALRQICTQEGPRVQQVLTEGRSAYGDLGIDDILATAALSRIAISVIKAELASDRMTSPPSLEQVFPLLVLRDVYLSEALLRGHGEAWTQFEELLEVAFRSVRSHFTGQTPQRVLDEIRESVLGTFFLDGKIHSFRATAPLGAWARQVVFNIFRQHMNRRRDGRESTALSQITDNDQEGAADALLPPSREPPPHELLHRAEWSEALERAVPEALDLLDRDERRMLEVLPTRRMTQIQLAEALGISPFKLNRWYKEVRARFLRSVTHRLRLLVGLEQGESERLMDYLVTLWVDRIGPDQDSPQSKEPGPS